MGEQGQGWQGQADDPESLQCHLYPRYGLDPPKTPSHYMDSECFMYIDRDTMESLYTACVTQKYIVGYSRKGTNFCSEEGIQQDSGEVKTYALKIISLKDDSREFRIPYLVMEIKTMKTVNHPCILKLYEVVTTPKPAKGVLLVKVKGELFDAIVINSNAN